MGITLLPGISLATTNIWEAAQTLFAPIYLASVGIIFVGTSVTNRPSTLVFAGVPADTHCQLGFTSGVLLTVLSPQVAIFYLVLLPTIEFSGLMWSVGVLLVGVIHAMFPVGLV